MKGSSISSTHIRPSVLARSCDRRLRIPRKSLTWIRFVGRACERVGHPDDHSRANRWIIIPLEVGQRVLIRMVLDSGAPFSAIGEGTRDDLLRLGLLSAAGTVSTSCGIY